jgi:hypothetical protein
VLGGARWPVLSQPDPKERERDMNMNNGASTLKRERDLRGVWRLDDNDRFYLEGESGREYGYRTHLTGSYVCYTCGHLCDCSEGEE